MLWLPTPNQGRVRGTVRQSGCGLDSPQCLALAHDAMSWNNVSPVRIGTPEYGRSYDQATKREFLRFVEKILLEPPVIFAVTSFHYDMNLLISKSSATACTPVQTCMSIFYSAGIVLHCEASTGSFALLKARNSLLYTQV